MDIYKTSDEIIKFYSKNYKEQEDHLSVDQQRAQYVYDNYQQQLMQTNFNEPLFKGYTISETCNPVSCRLIIFFTDTLVPYFIKNIVSRNTKKIDKVILNFTAVFNFIFFLIFDKYEYNEKKWIVQQINSLLKGLIQENIDYFKKNICISFDEQPRVKKNDFDCNFIMQISTGDNYNSKNSPYYVDDVLLEELKKVLKRCLSFWEIDDYENPGYAVAIGDTDYTYEITDENYNKICFSPFIVPPPKQIQLFPIEKDIGIMVFNMFSHYDTLMILMQEKDPSKVNEQLRGLFSQIETINQHTDMVDNFIGLNLSLDNIELINKFILCSYVFIILQSCKIFPKNKKYPETYDEIFTMFSNIDTKMINTVTYLTKISSIRQNFFLPVNTEDVIEYSNGREKTQPIVESALQSAEEQREPEESSSHIIDTPLQPLPPGWEEGKRPDNKTYYHNQSTGMTQMKRPETKETLIETIQGLKQYITQEQIIQVDNYLATLREEPGKEEEYRQKLVNMIQQIRDVMTDPLAGGSRSRSTKKTSIKKRIFKKPKKTIRNTK